MPVSGPTVVRRQLGRRLKQLRETAKKTAEQVEGAHLASRTTIWRVEKGQVEVKVPLVWALAKFYGAAEDETEALAALALGTKEQGWWQEYAGAMPEWFRLYVGLESGAARIQTWEDSVVPGELQTADYARAVYRAARTDDDHEAIERYVALRLARQERLFTRDPAPELVIILGEGVLVRPVGGADVLAAQIEHLRELDAREQIEIRVVPFTVGAHAAMTGAFRILDFADAEDPDVVYVEAQTGCRYLERADELDEYRAIFDLNRQYSIPLKEFSP